MEGLVGPGVVEKKHSCFGDAVDPGFQLNDIIGRNEGVSAQHAGRGDAPGARKMADSPERVDNLLVDLRLLKQRSDAPEGAHHLMEVFLHERPTIWPQASKKAGAHLRMVEIGMLIAMQLQ